MIRSLIHDNASFLIALALASIAVLGIALLVERLVRRVAASSRHTIVLAAMLAPLFLIATAALFPRTTATPAPAQGAIAVTHGAVVAQPRSPYDMVEAVAAAWLIGVLVALARGARSALYWRRVARLAEVTGGLAVSKECGEPMVIGILDPTIVFPAGGYLDGLTPEELDAILAHERAHIARRDNLIALLVQLTCALFWFDPIHRMARRRLVALRERACDEAVLERGCDVDSYLSALARSCEAPFRSSAVASMSRLQLRERMESIMTFESRSLLPTSMVRVFVVAAIAVAAVAFSLLAPSPNLTAAEVTRTEPATDRAVAAPPEGVDFTVQVVRGRKALYVLSLKSDVFTGVTEIASAPDIRTMTTTIGTRTYKWTFQVNSDGSGTANQEITEGATVIATSMKSFDAPSAIPPIPPPPPRPGVKRLDATMTPPKLLSRVEPVYPEVAKQSRIAGIVIVELVINEDGSVSDARVIKPLPYGLDQAALDAIRQWRFAPATVDGKPVPVLFNITINFKPD